MHQYAVPASPSGIASRRTILKESMAAPPWPPLHLPRKSARTLPAQTSMTLKASLWVYPAPANPIVTATLTKALTPGKGAESKLQARCRMAVRSRIQKVVETLRAAISTRSVSPGDKEVSRQRFQWDCNSMGRSGDRHGDLLLLAFAAQGGHSIPWHPGLKTLHPSLPSTVPSTCCLLIAPFT